MKSKKPEKRYRVLGRVNVPLVRHVDSLQEVTLYNGMSMDALPPQESDYVYLTKAQIEEAKQRYKLGISNLIQLVAEAVAREIVEEQRQTTPPVSPPPAKKNKKRSAKTNRGTISRRD
jgi:hypothetical protein